MTHLFVDLYDRVDDRFPCCTLDDHDVNHRQYFHDLRQNGMADRADRVVVRYGDEYRPGDHVRLLGQIKPRYVDTIAVDPMIAAEVDLNEVIFRDQGFANRAEALLFVTNPNPDCSFRLRVSLYDQVRQQLPSLVFYDWEYPPGLGSIDLNLFHFAHKVALVCIERGPAYQTGDKVLLWAVMEPKAQALALEPGDHDLTQIILVEERGSDLF